MRKRLRLFALLFAFGLEFAVPSTVCAQYYTSSNGEFVSDATIKRRRRIQNVAFIAIVATGATAAGIFILLNKLDRRNAHHDLRRKIMEREQRGL